MTIIHPMDSLIQSEFAPIAEVKAKLSAMIRKISGGKRLLITSHGRPQAVLLSYRDYLDLLREKTDSRDSPVGQIDFKQWKGNRARRKEVRSGLLRHFDPAKLPRKGQKAFKRKRVDFFEA